MNLIDVTRQFPTEDHCLDFLENQRWPDGVIRCAVCGCAQVSRITRKTPGKNKRTRSTSAWRRPANSSSLRPQARSTTGRICRLVKWFAAISLMVDAKKGLSALQMQQHLGIRSYKTAWYLCHRIRKAMIEANPTPMSGTVEVDETYLGGTAIRKFRKTITVRPPKDTVLAIRERSYQGKVGRVRFFHIPDAKRDTIHPIIQANVAA